MTPNNRDSRYWLLAAHHLQTFGELEAMQRALDCRSRPEIQWMPGGLEGVEGLAGLAVNLQGV